ncbi:unknown [Coprobacillus sp. CAG:605]|nr:unknown [Coprobacillus sp. CAG:605]
MRRKFFYLISFFFILGLILILATMVSSSNFNTKELLEDGSEYMASYIDDEYQNEIPSKNDGYIVDKIVCDNGAVATWDNDECGIAYTN